MGYRGQKRTDHSEGVVTHIVSRRLRCDLSSSVPYSPYHSLCVVMGLPLAATLEFWIAKRLPVHGSLLHFISCLLVLVSFFLALSISSTLDNIIWDLKNKSGK
jgi:hypothetical protein